MCTIEYIKIWRALNPNSFHREEWNTGERERERGQIPLISPLRSHSYGTYYTRKVILDATPYRTNPLLCDSSRDRQRKSLALPSFGRLVIRCGWMSGAHLSHPISARVVERVRIGWAPAVVPIRRARLFGSRFLEECFPPGSDYPREILL